MLNKNNVDGIIAELKVLSKSNINKEVELLGKILGYTKEDLQELKEECRNNILELRRELKNEFNQEVIFLSLDDEQGEQNNKVENILYNFEDLQSNISIVQDTELYKKYIKILSNKENLKDTLYYAIENNIIESMLQDLNIIFNY